ncbi:hypothetical protein DDZ18_09110 [Marinicauda salina]|uniref:Sulfotransferase family protein n=1 Tax=Marinicauda salina TaxID=2135793 RepID=A0A2U2BV36_9PROT|nr:hypothetical protein DDZ18_09110 [Marinicauda salina]
MAESPGEARDAAVRRLAERPDDPLAALVRAEATRRLGDAGAALRLVEAALALHADHAPLELERARCHVALGDEARARKRLEALLKRREDFAPGWKALADLRQRAGEEEGAAEAARRHAEATIGSPELARAAELLRRGRLGHAEHALRQYVKDHPTDVSGIRLLADVALRLGVLEDARHLLERCLELAPDFNLARHDYANVLLKQQQYEAAGRELERLIADEPENPSHRVLQALLHVRTGRLEEACELYADILARHPRQAKVQLSYGHALKTVGRREDAVAAYRAAVSAQPTLGEAYWSLANLKTVRFDGADIEAMQTALEDESISAHDRFHLQFALGKALEDARRYDDAFEAYAAGNALRRETVQYDPDRIEAETDALMAFFSREFFAEREGWGDPRPDPIFIVGMPRSGSTLQEQILASHSQVDGTFELPDIISMARRLSGKRRPGDRSAYPEILGSLTREEAAALGAEYLERTRIHRGGAPFFIDKMPNNFMHIGLIKLILPNATIIDARRHPMACGFSNFKQLFARGQNFTYSLEEIGRYYVNYVRLMAFWDEVLPGGVLRVIYEDVVADIETQVRRTLAHAGLAFEPQCVEFYSTDRAVRTASSEQVRQPIYATGLEQWRNFEPHLSPLATALRPVLEGDLRWDE